MDTIAIQPSTPPTIELNHSINALVNEAATKDNLAEVEKSLKKMIDDNDTVNSEKFDTLLARVNKDYMILEDRDLRIMSKQNQHTEELIEINSDLEGLYNDLQRKFSIALLLGGFGTILGLFSSACMYLFFR